MPKVSVIIPFNNVEPYIKQCMDSVLCQTLEDIEVICINDASSDNSKNIVEEYMQKDGRVKLINLDERQGQGYARNRGIEIAKGEYIGFVDSDDYIEPEMYEKLYNTAKKNDNDITICQAREYDDINEKFIFSDYYSLSVLEYLGDKVFCASDIKQELLNINVVLWNKIYKREYLINSGETFPEGFIYEDMPFFFGTFLKAKRIQIVWENFYIYRINRKNSTMLQFNKKILDRIPMVSLTYEKLKEYEFLNDSLDKIKGWIINDLFHRYTLLKENFRKEFFFQMKKLFKQLDIKNLDNPFWKTVYHFEGYLLVINNTFDDFNLKVFTEYLDIHKVEDRIKSSVPDRDEIDRKISDIYSDISKNYDYTNQLSEKAQYNLETKAEEITSNINAQTGEKLSKVYEEITKNYDYTNQLSEKAQYNLEAKAEEITSNINAQTGEKLSKVYEEITKNYDYTNQLSEKAQYNLETKAEEITSNINAQTGEKISKIYEDIEKNYEYTNKLSEQIKENLELKTSELAENITKETDEKIYHLSDDLHQNYAKATDVTNKFDRLNLKAETEYKNIYEEIAFNSDKFKEITDIKTEELKNDIKEALSKFRDNINERIYINNASVDERFTNLKSDVNEKITAVYNKMQENSLQMNILIDNKSENLKNLIKQDEEKNTKEIYEKIQNQENKLTEEIENSKNIVREEIQTETQNTKNEITNTISQIENILNEKLETQKNEYEARIKILENKVKYLSKSPIEKLIDKMKKKAR